MPKTKDKQIKSAVKQVYGKAATQNRGCCDSGCGEEASFAQTSKSLGYSEGDVNLVPGANLGLGCGNPIAIGRINKGDVVLDLGSGAGFDCFLAAEKTGDSGKVIGVDMTEEMIAKARENAKAHGYENVEFKLGDIEDLPIEDNSIDKIISNCVINIAPNKSKVYDEAWRVLKKGGKMYISDIVLLGEIPAEEKNDLNSIATCVGGAVLKDDYIRLIEKAGFKVEVISENEKIKPGLPIASLNFEVVKK